ncbi:hypothetical protein [Streptomyces sp. 11-1-2]|uniref:hypothetical protein n=1 Tax=unclassified Streptomyces TaxID=2593676 RepID=UPI000B8D9494|nr:hypothetical protein [Streptomyces sp. 11-1-2]ASQ99829.1 hypothetical protein CGL27_48740 [Streptomyces sp. 11-1-2]
MHTFTRSRPAAFVRRLTVIAALTSLSLLTACSGEQESSGKAGDKDVASVTGGDKKSDEAVQVERPLIRPDTSKEEEWRLTQVHLDCLSQQGLKMIKNKGGETDGTYKGIDTRAEKNQNKIAAAKKVCAAKEPETLPQRAAREDPEYQDKYDKWLKCMRSHGLKVSATPDQPGIFSFDEGLPPADKEKWVKKCEAEAFVAK